MEKFELEPIKIVEKNWGREEILDNRKEYCCKFLIFNKGKKCSWHHHDGHLKKTETFYLLKGKLKVYLSEQDDIEKANIVIMNPGDRLFIYPGLRHRMEAIQQSKLLEISTEDFEECNVKLQKGD